LSIGVIEKIGGGEDKGVVCAIQIMHGGYILLKPTSELAEVQEV